MIPKDAEVLRLVNKLKRSTTNPEFLTILEWAEKELTSRGDGVLTTSVNNQVEDVVVNNPKRQRNPYFKDYMRKRRAKQKQEKV